MEESEEKNFGGSRGSDPFEIVDFYKWGNLKRFISPVPSWRRQYPQRVCRVSPKLKSQDKRAAFTKRGRKIPRERRRDPSFRWIVLKRATRVKFPEKFPRGEVSSSSASSIFDRTVHLAAKFVTWNRRRVSRGSKNWTNCKWRSSFDSNYSSRTYFVYFRIFTRRSRERNPNYHIFSIFSSILPSHMSINVSHFKWLFFDSRAFHSRSFTCNPFDTRLIVVRESKIVIAKKGKGNVICSICSKIDDE